MTKIKKIEFKPQPRQGNNSKNPGAYQQVITVIKPVINPGDDIELEQYFTGYGEINGAKVLSFPSSQIFSQSESHIISGIKLEGNNISFGSHEDLFEDGVVIDVRGVKAKDWSSPTHFFDANENDDIGVPLIITETKIGSHAPINYKLKTRKHIKPGSYSLEFVFTYFNGEKWVSDSKTIGFKVQNILERYSMLIGILALTASISAIYRFIIQPLFSYLYK